MKTLLNFLLLLAGLNFSCVPPQREIPEETHAGVTFQVFYDELSPYGHWISHPTQGYVWLPMDDPDFLPYSTRGHWVWTDYGWTWISEYRWGWAPFHYGRWDYNPEYGWYWIPDNVWGPGWVVWQEYPGYYGWAPLRPGINITIVIGGGYYPPDPWWTFCHRKYFGRRDMRNHFEPRKKIGRIKDGESRVIANTNNSRSNVGVFLTGPARDAVQRETGEHVERVAIENSSKPGESFNNTTWTVYHPEIERIPASKTQPVPRTVTKTVASEKQNPVTPNTKQPATPNSIPPQQRTAPRTVPHNIPQEKRTPNPAPKLPAPNDRIPSPTAPKNEAPAKVPSQEANPQKIPKQESTPRTEQKRVQSNEKR